jgi:hypothetical protein
MLHYHNITKSVTFKLDCFIVTTKKFYNIKVQPKCQPQLPWGGLFRFSQPLQFSVYGRITSGFTRLKNSNLSSYPLGLIAM